MSRRQLRANLTAASVGAVATVFVILLAWAGWLERIELATLDVRFRHPWINSIRDGGQVACVGIDDASLIRGGRWPWPRRVQAEMISIIQELGARALLVDLEFGEPEVISDLPPPEEEFTDDLLRQERDASQRVFPDAMLRCAIHLAKQVYLAYHTVGSDFERSAEFQEAVDAFASGDAVEAERRLRARERRLRRESPKLRDIAGKKADVESVLRHARQVAAIESQRHWDASTPPPGFAEPGSEAYTLGVEAQQRCLEAALRRSLRNWMSADAARWDAPRAETIREFYATVSPRRFEDATPLRELVFAAWRDVVGYEFTTRDPIFPLERVARIAREVDAISPVYFLHAREARRCGFVDFEPDVDGRVRRLPLLLRHGDRLLVQLAFAVGCDVLGVTVDDLRMRRDGFEIGVESGSARSLNLQLDRKHRTMIPWVPEEDYIKLFHFVSASVLWNMQDRREKIRLNRSRLLDVLYENREALTQTTARDVVELADQLATRMSRQIQAQLDGDFHEVRESAVLVKEGEAALHGKIRELAARAEGHQAADAEATKLARFFSDAYKLIRPSEELAAENEKDFRRLQERVRDRIVVLGHSATALADFKPTPTNEQAPGMLAHANLLNGMLTGRLVRWASPTLNTTITAALGLLATALSVSLHPRRALPLLLSALVVYVGLFGWLAFYRWTFWFWLVPPTGAALLSFVAILMFRFLFLDRERRELATALGQYTSRQIAKQVAENAELCRRAEMREVSAMFTDLRGFTGISERIGAERTQRVLNVCLGRFTDVLLKQEGMVNKFLGDGVFAFWNPVIYPQSDHARRSCEAAVNLLAALERLKEEQRRAGGDEIFDALRLRIGTATGNAIVGPCGSEQKFDYTCIGDSVNTAARLEAANKFYGTSILVSGTTRIQAGDAFAFRSLGLVEVKGKQEVVEVYELLGRRDEVSRDVLRFAERFDRAVDQFIARRFAEAIEAFESLRAEHPGDVAIAHFAGAAQLYAELPPPDDWKGALESIEK